MSDTRSNEHGEASRRRILEMGVQLWRADPSYITARRIAHELGITHSAVLYHFVTTLKLKNAIAYYAVQNGDSRVIASLISTQHPAVATMDETQRLEHMRLAAARF